MLISIVTLVLSLILLVWSADRFVDGSASLAKFYGMPSLLIGMVVIGFGTSAPELFVSTISAYQGNAGIAIGNAYGSNITNIALILGATALFRPITVHSQVLRQELPILTLVSILTFLLILDLEISRFNALILIAIFAALITWSILKQVKSNPMDIDAFAKDVDHSMTSSFNIRKSILNLVAGLLLLLVSSRLFVWGAVNIATALGVSQVVIGLTIVAVGTSLPELASSIIAARKGESDLALGNILGSNLFNTLAVIGFAGLIRPLSVDQEVLYRDLPVMLALTLSLFVICFGFRSVGRINRIEGLVLLVMYVIYTVYLL